MWGIDATGAADEHALATRPPMTRHALWDSITEKSLGGSYQGQFKHFVRLNVLYHFLFLPMAFEAIDERRTVFLPRPSMRNAYGGHGIVLAGENTMSARDKVYIGATRSASARPTND
ncbi:hypothetical protein RU639_009388 [Aspergillus parasiticus]